MSLHITEPRGTRPKNRMFPIWKCDVIETDSGAVVETTLPQKTPEQAQQCAARIKARLEERFPTRPPHHD